MALALRTYFKQKQRWNSLDSKKKRYKIGDTCILQTCFSEYVNPDLKRIAKAYDGGLPFTTFHRMTQKGFTLMLEGIYSLRGVVHFPVKELQEDLPGYDFPWTVARWESFVSKYPKQLPVTKVDIISCSCNITATMTVSKIVMIESILYNILFHSITPDCHS